jgi:hypothetical protein
MYVHFLAFRMMLTHSCKLSTCEEFQKYVVLVMDEMHIREDLVYDKHSGELVGFVNRKEKRTIASFSLSDKWKAVHLSVNLWPIPWLS